MALGGPRAAVAASASLGVAHGVVRHMSSQARRGA